MVVKGFTRTSRPPVSRRAKGIADSDDEDPDGEWDA